MDDVLRQRLQRHIDALPDAQAYQVLDYIEFLTSKYARAPVRGPSNPVQRFGERLQDRLRAQGVGIRAMRGTLDAVGTADRVFAGLSDAGRTLIREVEEGFKPDPERAGTSVSRSSTSRSLPPAPAVDPPETRDIPVD